jgi:hypothetical protein
METWTCFAHAAHAEPRTISKPSAIRCGDTFMASLHRDGMIATAFSIAPSRAA